MSAAETATFRILVVAEEPTPAESSNDSKVGAKGATPAASARAAAVGWDPYEVWRSRVHTPNSSPSVRRRG